MSRMMEEPGNNFVLLLIIWVTGILSTLYTRTHSRQLNTGLTYKYLMKINRVLPFFLSENTYKYFQLFLVKLF